MPTLTRRRAAFVRMLPLLVACAALTVPAIALAQGPSSPPTMNKGVRVGLPTGAGDSGRMRQGAWAPVYITLTGGPNGNGQQQYKVVLDALDAEDNPYRYTVPVPALSSAVQTTVIGYLRAPNQEFTATLETLDGKTVQGPFKQLRSSDAEPLKPIVPLFVVIGGATLPKLKAALLPDPAKPGEVEDLAGEANAARGYARITKVDDLPDYWFGYDAADAIVLTTDNDTFMNEFIGKDAEKRRKALAEWVRRGGKLVLSVGRNTQAVGSLLRDLMPLPEVDRMPLLPFTVDGNVQRKRLPELTGWAEVDRQHVVGDGSKSDIDVAKIVPIKEEGGTGSLGAGVRVLATEAKTDKDPEPRPVVIEAPCGLGRVLLIAVDVDGAAFTDWKDTGLGATPLNQPQRKFWVKVREHLSQLFNPNDIKKHENNWEGRDSPELMLGLEQYIDTFEDVPVISFGWVAGFIFLYILIVGPLDYFILKKVFKRLELTWVTFPIVVLTISMGAYFIAYALKGDDMRVNKVDVVDIDLQTPQAYGTSWFSVFSPRMQNYTFGIEPAFGGPAGGLTPPKASTVVSVLENPAAAARGGSTTLFRQPYEYAQDASGVEHVPIPVWSTRMFTASWRTPFPADKPPIRADLKRARDGLVTGKIINDMAVDLEDVCLIYHNHWYPLPGNRTLAAKGDLFEVGGLVMMDAGGRGNPMDSWFKDPILTVNRKVTNPARRRNNDNPTPMMGPTWTEKMKEIMFYREKSTVTNALNSGLRPINQSWRLSAPDEVILVARTPYASGKAAKINNDGLVRLWNDKLPAAGEQCPDLSGYLNQETYIRVYIPVKNQ